MKFKKWNIGTPAEQDLAVLNGEDAGAHGDDLVVTDFAAKGFDVIHVHCLSCGFF